MTEPGNNMPRAAAIRQAARETLILLYSAKFNTDVKKAGMGDLRIVAV